MTAEFDARVRKMIKKGEGSIPHMYLDTRRKVTVAVGNLLPTAESAATHPFVIAKNGEAASKEQIIAEFENVSRQKKGMVASRYKKYTRLVLTDDYIDTLLDKRLEKFVAQLKKDFKGFGKYPDEARMGLIDMAFNLGNKGLLKKFPTFTRAARDKDWKTCARECRRKGIGKMRNAETRELFLAAAEPEQEEKEEKK